MEKDILEPLQKSSQLTKFGGNLTTLAVSAISLGCIFLLEQFYRKPLLDYSLSENGIQAAQENASEIYKQTWLFISNLGGGQENKVVLVIGFVFGRRGWFLYACAMCAIASAMVSFFKLSYAEPRPWMITSEIQPYSCCNQFGNPSGHAFAANVFASFVYLDRFHSTGGDRQQQGVLVQVIIVLALLVWAAAIPYSRYLLGVHSINQLIFGSTLGIWDGFTLHYLMRDQIIKDGAKGFLKTIIGCVGIFTATTISVYYFQQATLTPESSKVQMITKNYGDSVCMEKGPYDIKKTLLANIKGCGAAIYLSFFFIFQQLRKCDIPVMDGTWSPKTNRCNLIVFHGLKLIIFGTIMLSSQQLKHLMNFSDPIFSMVFEIILPGIVATAILILGPYDYLIHYVYQKLDK